ncbi:unnamed protein product, partial [Urochloa humidicola]
LKGCSAADEADACTGDCACSSFDYLIGLFIFEPVDVCCYAGNLVR